MKTRLFWMTVAAVMMAAVVASAQNTVRRSSASSYQQTRRIELIPMAGYAWTMSMDIIAAGYPGKLDFTDKGYYGGAIDFTVTPPGAYKEAQARLMYRRSDGDVQLRGFAQRYDFPAAIEYWQIGGLTGIKRGNALPFATVSLGGSRLIVKDGSINGVKYTGSDSWKFSMIFGLGVKVYTSPRVGLMLQANWPITFTDAWGGVYVGTGGASVGISGTGISQLDLGGGLIINL